MALPHLAPIERLRAGVGGRRLTGLVALIAAGVFGAACADRPTVLAEETYIDVMAQLAWSRVRYMDTPADDSIRAAVLEEYGLSGDDLLDFADRHGRDVERMDRIWEAIRVRVGVLDGAPIPENQDQDGALDPASGR